MGYVRVQEDKRKPLCERVCMCDLYKFILFSATQRVVPFPVIEIASVPQCCAISCQSESCKAGLFWEDGTTSLKFEARKEQTVMALLLFYKVTNEECTAVDQCTLKPRIDQRSDGEVSCYYYY